MDPELAAEIARGYAAAKGRTDDIRADFTAAVRAAAAPEAVQTQEHGGAAEAPEQATPASTGHERAPEPTSEHETTRGIGGIVGGLADGAVTMLGKVLDVFAGMFESLFASPPPPPAPEEQRRAERVAEEQREQAAAEREAVEREARFQELLEQIRRDDAERERQSLAERFGRARDYDRDDDYDRGRERER